MKSRGQNEVAAQIHSWRARCRIQNLFFLPPKYTNFGFFKGNVRILGRHVTSRTSLAVHPCVPEALIIFIYAVLASRLPCLEYACTPTRHVRDRAFENLKWSAMECAGYQLMR